MSNALSEVAIELTLVRDAKHVCELLFQQYIARESALEELQHAIRTIEEVAKTFDSMQFHIIEGEAVRRGFERINEAVRTWRNGRPLK